MENDFYVYVLYRPWDGLPCYVGKGRGPRCLRHFRQGVNHRNKELAAVFKRAARLEMVVPLKKRYRGLTEEAAFYFENLLIHKYGGPGALANKTYGGEGLSGFKHSSQTKQKQREAHLGKIFSAEHRARIGAASKGRKFSKEARAKMRLAMLKRYEDPEERRKTGASRLGYKHSKATKDKISAAHKLANKNPQVLARRSAGARRGWRRRKRLQAGFI